MARATAGRASQSLVLTGLRGVGKTVLLNDLARRARAADWIVAQVEARLNAETDDPSFRATLARSLNQSLRQVTGGWGLREKVRAALATFKAFSVKTDPSGSLALGIEVEPRSGRADTGSLELDLSELAFDLAASAADLGTGVVLFIDEMQDLSREELSAVCAAVHETGQRSAPFYVVGAGLPSLPGDLADARSYAERLFEYRRIGPLSAEAAGLAVSRPAELPRIELGGERDRHCRRGIGRLPLLPSRVRQGHLGLRSRTADRGGRRSNRSASREREARHRLLPQSLEPSHGGRA